MEATTFLVGENGLNSEAFRIQVTCLVCRGHIRDEMERLLIPFGPATEEHHRAIGGFCHAHICELDQGPRLDTGRHGLAPEALPVPQHGDVAPCSDYIGPMIALYGVLECGAIELAI